MLQYSEKVNPHSDVNRIAGVGVNAIGNHQEKNAPFPEEDFAFIKSLKNMKENKSKISPSTKLCSGNQQKISSDLSPWSDVLQVENVITLKDFGKWKKNGIDEALRNRFILTLSIDTNSKEDYFSSKSSCNLRVEARKNWARRPTQFHLTVHL